MATPRQGPLAHTQDTGVPASSLSRLGALLEDLPPKHQKDLF